MTFHVFKATRHPDNDGYDEGNVLKKLAPMIRYSERRIKPQPSLNHHEEFQRHQAKDVKL